MSRIIESGKQKKHPQDEQVCAGVLGNLHRVHVGACENSFTRVKRHTEAAWYGCGKENYKHGKHSVWWLNSSAVPDLCAFFSGR